MAGRGRNRMPEVRRGQGERRPGPDQPDFRSRHLRRGVSAQGRSARRKQRQFRLCRRRSAAARHASATSRAGRSRSRRLRRTPPPYPDNAHAPARLRRAIQRSDFADARPASRRTKTKSNLPPDGTPGRRRSSGRIRSSLSARRRYPPQRRIRSAAVPRLSDAGRRACRGSGLRRAIRSPPSGRSRSSRPRRWPVRSSRCSTAGSPIPCSRPRMRWFGARVVEIKQISAYSCRGMNGNPNAHISEHAFGNALDIAAFTLADGRRISVKDGWKGMPEEQGFLRDVQAAACQQFTTVLAPGSNVYHYDHIHVDLMRRASRRLICQPAAVSGEEVAARAQAAQSLCLARAVGRRDRSAAADARRKPAEGQRGRRVRGRVAVFRCVREFAYLAPLAGRGSALWSSL